jgi:excinuclease ABC subunit C
MPDNAQYRRFKIKTVHQSDDFAMMGEVLRRRLRRGQDEGNLPDLLIVDGGKGQLAVAVHVMRELGIDAVALAGLAKARVQEADPYAKDVIMSEERLFLPNRKNPVVLARNSSALHLVTRIRDEAHRFAITYHRLLRRKGIKSSLAEVPGVGAKRQKALLRHFGSVRAMKVATVEDLVGVAGINRAVAEQVFAFLHDEGQTSDGGSQTPEA